MKSSSIGFVVAIFMVLIVSPNCALPFDDYYNTCIASCSDVGAYTNAYCRTILCKQFAPPPAAADVLLT